jgi:hypothetical protein
VSPDTSLPSDVIHPGASHDTLHVPVTGAAVHSNSGTSLPSDGIQIQPSAAHDNLRVPLEGKEYSHSANPSRGSPKPDHQHLKPPTSYYRPYMPQPPPIAGYSYYEQLSYGFHPNHSRPQPPPSAPYRHEYGDLTNQRGPPPDDY